MFFALCKEWQRVKVMRAWRNVSTYRQSRWLSKERSCWKGKIDRCQNKGDSNLAQIGTRRRGWRPGPSRTSLGVNKSEVEQFEWSLITLLSVAGFFYEVNRYLYGM